MLNGLRPPGAGVVKPPRLLFERLPGGWLSVSTLANGHKLTLGAMEPHELDIAVDLVLASGRCEVPLVALSDLEVAPARSTPPGA